MAHKSDLKESFAVEQVHAAFYTGGKIKWSRDGQLLFCQTTSAINVLELDTGSLKCTLSPEEGTETRDAILCFTIDSCAEHVITCHQSGIFGFWSVKEGKKLKSWKSVHRGPVSVLTLGFEDNLVASGGTDGVIRLWDLTYQSCSAALRGAQGVISVVEFYELSGKKVVFGCGDDLAIHCWCIETGSILHSLTGHYSKITSLAAHPSQNFLVSSSRDKVLMLWDLTTWKCVNTVPLYEGLESIVVLPEKLEFPGGNISGEIYVASAGETGTIRVVAMQSGRVIYTSEQFSSITQLLFNTHLNALGVVTVDHNIAVLKLDDFSYIKLLIGYTDEILDLALMGSNDSHLAVATNNKDILLYEMKNYSCQLLKGHSDHVLALSVATEDPRLLLSASKDGSVRLWELNVAKNVAFCVAVGQRHTAAVSAVSFLKLRSDMFLSASMDTTLKLWSWKDSVLTAFRTEVAHSKEINSIGVSPNDRIVATGSQDKTVKLWDLNNLALLGVLNGHRRGVWSVCFSPVDQVLLTSSADCTMKLWSISDMTCLKTFQGHESSVMSAQFLSAGMQIISVSGDGLMKLWTIKSGECIATYDAHEGKIWALTVSTEEGRLVSGGSDSRLSIWKDDTVERRLNALQLREKQLLQQQKLDNLLRSDRLLEALSLALDLDMPFKVLNILKDLKKSEPTLLVETIGGLADEQKEKLLKCAVTWNSNAKHCYEAQLVISTLLKDVASEKLVLPGLRKFVEDALPYTERHFKRLTSTLQNLHLLQYTIQKINPALSST